MIGLDQLFSNLTLFQPWVAWESVAIALLVFAPIFGVTLLVFAPFELKGKKAKVHLLDLGFHLQIKNATVPREPSCLLGYTAYIVGHETVLC